MPVFIQKMKFINIHILVFQFRFTQNAQYTAIKLPYTLYRYVEVSILNCIALRRISILLHFDIVYCDSSTGFYNSGYCYKTDVWHLKTNCYKPSGKSIWVVNGFQNMALLTIKLCSLRPKWNNCRVKLICQGTGITHLLLCPLSATRFRTTMTSSRSRWTLAPSWRRLMSIATPLLGSGLPTWTWLQEML